MLVIGFGFMANPSWSLPIRLNALQAVEASQPISIHQAVQSVKSRYPGSKVLGAQTVQEQGQTIYIIKIVTAQGVIKHVRVNAGG